MGQVLFKLDAIENQGRCISAERLNFILKVNDFGENFSILDLKNRIIVFLNPIK